jgi:hypothetical protein
MTDGAAMVATNSGRAQAVGSSLKRNSGYLQNVVIRSWESELPRPWTYAWAAA